MNLTLLEALEEIKRLKWEAELRDKELERLYLLEKSLKTDVKNT